MQMRMIETENNDYSFKREFIINNNSNIRCYYVSKFLINEQYTYNKETGINFVCKTRSRLMVIIRYIFAISIILLPLQRVLYEKHKLYRNGQFLGYLNFGMHRYYNFKPRRVKLGKDYYEICVHNNQVFSITKNNSQIARINFSKIKYRYVHFNIHYDKHEDETFIVCIVLYLHYFFWQPGRRGNGVIDYLDDCDPYPERAFWFPDDEKDE